MAMKFRNFNSIDFSVPQPAVSLSYTPGADRKTLFARYGGYGGHWCQSKGIAVFGGNTSRQRGIMIISSAHGDITGIFSIVGLPNFFAGMIGNHG